MFQYVIKYMKNNIQTSTNQEMEMKMQYSAELLVQQFQYENRVQFARSEKIV